jgi:hypothetical protein
MCLSNDTLLEFKFWRSSLSGLNSRRIVENEFLYSRVCYSDASSTGCASFIDKAGISHVAHHNWDQDDIKRSSSFREIKAISLGLKSFGQILRGHTIKWYTDNQAVARMVEVGSMKEHLQLIALDIFNFCICHAIQIEVEWIPRGFNERADFLSRIIDYDDWMVSPELFSFINARWGPHTVDRFSNHQNNQVPRFNSRFWCPGSEHVDAFSLSWRGENNWVVPPIYLIPRVVKHMIAARSVGTLIVPEWPSNAFWPLLFNGLSRVKFIIDTYRVSEGVSVFVQGNYKNSLFGSSRFRSAVLFLRFDGSQ